MFWTVHDGIGSLPFSTDFMKRCRSLSVWHSSLEQTHVKFPWAFNTCYAHLYKCDWSRDNLHRAGVCFCWQCNHRSCHIRYLVFQWTTERFNNLIELGFLTILQKSLRLKSLKWALTSIARHSGRAMVSWQHLHSNRKVRCSPIFSGVRTEHTSRFWTNNWSVDISKYEGNRTVGALLALVTNQILIFRP